MKTAKPGSPQILKAHRVDGRTLRFHNATINDAQFILQLRTNHQKSKHLSKVSGELEDQISWLTEYSRTNNQAYFIIKYQDNPIGCVRLYDAQGDSFCWGSWILNNNSPAQSGIESALMVYSYAQDYLGFSSAHFDVRKENEHVWRFHERFGAVRTAESELDYIYMIDPTAIKASRARYQRYLGSPVKVYPL